jgi:hypothetical protein
MCASVKLGARILELYFGFVCISLLAAPSFLDRFVPPVVRRVRSYTSSVWRSARHSSSNDTFNARPDPAVYNKDSSSAGKPGAPALEFLTQMELESQKQLVA